MDFFSYGKISNAFENISVKPFVYIKKEDTYFENGVILIDFATLDSELDNILKMVKDMKFEQIYIENSNKFSIESLVKKLSDIEVILLNFSDNNG